MPKFKIHFADSLPEEPGTGGPDNDFYAEFDYTGTFEEAQDEARRLSSERYHGDFKWWVTPEKTSEVYVAGAENPKKGGVDPLRLRYPFLEQIIARLSYPLFGIEEATVDDVFLAGKCSSHGSEGPESFDEQVYSVSNGEAKKLAAGREPSPSIREELSSGGIRADFLVKERHLKYEAGGQTHHDVVLTVCRT